MSKIEARKLVLDNQPFSVTVTMENIKSIIGVQADAKQQSLVFNTAEDAPETLIGDAMRMSQVLINLLSNAVKFTPAGGRIEVSLKKIRLIEDDDELEITVKDSGIGISADQKTRLFNVFEQADSGVARRFGGTGLGLAISRHIALLMKGDITVESEPGRGSCFTFRFRMKHGGPEMFHIPETYTEPGEYDFHGHTILLVEDVEINREIILGLVEDTGLQVDCAEFGQIALDMFLKDQGRYDLIYMDIQMPVMDGYTATRNLRNTNIPEAKTIPIIAMTANAFAEDVERCLAVGMNDHIPKPIDTETFLDKTARYLTKVNAADPTPVSRLT
jgi:CheY-like chemotaxis protein